MVRSIESLELELLGLPAVDRARLLDRVVASLDADRARDEAWDQVAATRDSEIERGTTSALSGDEAIITEIRDRMHARYGDSVGGTAA